MENLREALDKILLERLLHGTGCLKGPLIRLETELVYIWYPTDTWIPISVDDVASVTIFLDANMVSFSLKDSENYSYIPLRDSGITLKDLEDCFGKKLIVKQSLS